MTGSDQRNPPNSEATRRALAMAALKLFGEKGFDATSTREVAAEAKANIGSIAYHFGGKEGLRAGVADLIVETIGTLAGPVLGNLDDTLPDMTAEQAEAQLYAAADRLVTFVVATPEAGNIVQFCLRELSRPTETLDRIYDGIFGPMHRRLCLLWARAVSVDPDSEDTRLTVFTFIGQVMYFRIGSEVVQRRMGWTAIGTAEATAITRSVRANLAAALAAHRNRNP